MIACRHGGHGFGALANDFINNGQGFSIVITDGDGTAQKQTVQLDVDKLAAVGDIRGVANQNHFIHRVRQPGIAADLENALFHSISFG